MKEAFKQVGPSLNIRLLSDGDELLNGLQEATELPRLVLLDLNMQRKHGFEALAELRSISVYKKLPVIILTTSAGEDEKRKAVELGANGFLTKPASQSATIDMLKKLMIDWSLN